MIQKPTKYKPTKPPEWVKYVNKHARKFGLPPVECVCMVGFHGSKYTYKRQYVYRDPPNEW